MFETLNFHLQGSIGTLQFARPDAQNAINTTLVNEFHRVLDAHERDLKLLVIEGSPDVFCAGGDFQAIVADDSSAEEDAHAQELYELWQRLATGPFISVAHVRARAQAGGVGFVAACDLVIAESQASFTLSELIFGLYPACVFPFLARRIGGQRAQYMALSTMAISAKEAYDWGLVDVINENSSDALRRHLLRLRRVSKTGVAQFKRYRSELNDDLEQVKSIAIRHNRAMFKDPTNRDNISRFVNEGLLPWQ